MNGPAEFDCVECGRHIVVLTGPVSEFHLCAACTCIPGWHTDPRLRAAFAAADFKSYELQVGADGRAAIECRVCGLVSFNPNDVRERYCGHCHLFHEDRP